MSKRANRFGWVLLVGLALATYQSAALGQQPQQLDGRIAFVSGRDGNVEIYTMWPDGSGVVRVTNDPAIDYQPAWSPDGRDLAFTSSRGNNWDIYRVAASLDEAEQSAAVVQRLTAHRKRDESPAWSPKGHSLIYITYRGGNPQIWRMDALGENQEQLTNSRYPHLNAAWSPDAERVVFVAQFGSNTELYTLNLADTTDTPLSDDNPAPDLDPRWSPNGGSVVFSSGRDGNAEIYTITADGQTLQRLTNHPASDTQPAWSPDGQFIVFVSDRGGQNALYVIPAGGGQPQQISNGAGGDLNPAWGVHFTAEPRP
jgi:Tol biopolymer transport system component